MGENVDGLAITEKRKVEVKLFPRRRFKQIKRREVMNSVRLR